MPDKIHLTVATVIEKDNRFLMVLETCNHRQVINQPAGHVEPGEEILDAALRETKEETGWNIELKGLLSISTYFAPNNGVTYYRVSLVGTPLSYDADFPLDEDIDGIQWLSYEELLQSKDKLRSPLVMDCIEDYRAGRIYPLDIVRKAL